MGWFTIVTEESWILERIRIRVDGQVRLMTRVQIRVRVRVRLRDQIRVQIRVVRKIEDSSPCRIISYSFTGFIVQSLHPQRTKPIK